MPWLAKALLFALKTKRGRELLFAAALGAVEIAQSEPARTLYAKARKAADDPRPRQKASRLVRTVAAKARR